MIDDREVDPALVQEIEIEPGRYPVTILLNCYRPAFKTIDVDEPGSETVFRYRFSRDQRLRGDCP